MKRTTSGIYRLRPNTRATIWSTASVPRPRCWAIYEGTAATNTTWQGLLEGTVWANYELMGTQWQTVTDAPPFPTNRIPAYLANATMETYFQTTQSCLSCHTAATLAAQPTVSANFTWLLNREVVDPSTSELEPEPEEFKEDLEEAE